MTTMTICKLRFPLYSMHCVVSRFGMMFRYVLLRGTKRFRLFSPADAPRMYTVGRLRRIHPNGRINYEGEPTSADGLGLEEAAQAEWLDAAANRRNAERSLEDAEKALEAIHRADSSTGKQAAPSRRSEEMALQAVEDAEAAVECAMERLLRAKMALKARARGLPLRGGKERRAIGGASADGHGLSAARATPPNFSRIGALPRTAPKEWKKSTKLTSCFPGLLQSQCAELTLEEGCMLYLPCGWFHEVISVGEHSAINYWFHPPDTRSFRKPYRAATFWEREWRRVQRQLSADV